MERRGNGGTQGQWWHAGVMVARRGRGQLPAKPLPSFGLAFYIDPVVNFAKLSI